MASKGITESLDGAQARNQLQIRLLGAPEVRCGEHVLHFRTKKALALLVYLAVTGAAQPREQLAALFWPDSDDMHARALLRRTLAFLKEALKPAGFPLISTGRDALGRDILRFNTKAVSDDSPSSPVSIDIAILEHASRVATRSRTAGPTTPTPSDESLNAAALLDILERGANQYTGHFLDGVSLEDAPQWEGWVQGQRAYWQRQIALVFDCLAQLQLGTGQTAFATETAHRWTELAPFDEAAHMRLMQALVASGERALALETYATYRQRLRGELDMEPSPEMITLAERIRLQEVSGSVSPSNRSSLSGQQRGASASVSLDMPFVGRETEFGEVVAAYERARLRRKLEIVVIQGEVGIGKTRLIEEFAHWAEAHGSDAVCERAFETGGRLPYQPLVDALRGRLAKVNALEDLLDDVWLIELSRLFPELRERYPDLPAPVGDDSTAQHRLFEAVAQLVLTFARPSQRTVRSRPELQRDAGHDTDRGIGAAVRLFDDLHWADAGTRDLMTYLLRRFEDEQIPALVVLALCAEQVESRQELREWLHNLERHHDATVLVLGPLSEQSIRSGFEDMLRADLYDSLPTWLYRETAGRPLYLRQIVHMLFERGVLRWTEASEVDQSRSGRPLSGVHMELSGHSDVFAHLQGLVPPSMRAGIVERLEQLSQPARRLMSAAAVLGMQFDFEQAAGVAELSESAALDALEEAERRLLVRLVSQGSEVAMRYEFTHDKLCEVTYTEIGEARRRSLHRRSLAVLERVGGASAMQLARHAVAAGLTEPAFHYSVLAGDEALSIFAVQDAITHYEHAWRLLTDAVAHPEKRQREFFSPAEQEHLQFHLGRAYEWHGEWDQARRMYEALRQYAHERTAYALEGTALTRLALVAQEQTWDLPAARKLAGEALAVVESTDDTSAVAEAHWALAEIASQHNDLEMAQRHIERALELAQAADLPELVARGLLLLWQVRMFQGEWNATVTIASEGAMRYAALAEHASEARVGQSDQLARETAVPPEPSARLLWSGSPPTTRAAYLVMEAACLAGVCVGETNRGEPEAGIAAGRLALTLSEAARNDQVVALSSYSLALGLIDMGDYEEALHIARRGVEAAAESGELYSLVATKTALAQALDALQDFEEALPLLNDAVATAERIPATYWSLRPLSYLCSNRALAGDWRVAEVAAQRATVTRAGLHSRLMHFDFMRYHEIEALLRADRVEQARAGVRHLGARVRSDSQDRRFLLVHRRMQAALAHDEHRLADAVERLNEALQLAEESGLQGEQWQIAARLAQLYREVGDQRQSDRACGRASTIIQDLARRITDAALREGFLARAMARVRSEESLHALS